MLGFQELITHLKDKHNLSVDKNQERDLQNTGYYHGYKGYRFIRKSSNSIEFTTFSQMVTLNRFDMRLKSILYPRLMFIETALKRYVKEVVLADCRSENLSEVCKKSLTYYKEFSPKDTGGKDRTRYKEEFKKRKDLEMKINTALIRDYMQGKEIENHFFDNDRDIPLWAAFESLTLREFGVFFSC